MSLVMAFCLNSGDTLLVADKGIVFLDAAGNTAGRTDDGKKLFNYSGGIIGYAGYAGLAADMIQHIPALVSSDPVLELQYHLVSEYSRLTGVMPETQKDGQAVEFLYAGPTGRVHIFRSSANFSPELIDWWGAIGVTALATYTYCLFYNDVLKCGLEHAKRLAALQILITSDATKNVSPRADMWLLKKDGKGVQVLPDTEAVMQEMCAYRHKVITGLYQGAVS